MSIGKSRTDWKQYTILHGHGFMFLSVGILPQLTMKLANTKAWQSGDLMLTQQHNPTLVSWECPYQRKH